MYIIISKVFPDIPNKWLQKLIYLPSPIDAYFATLTVGGVDYVSVDKVYGDNSNSFEETDMDGLYATIGLTPTALGPSDATVMYYDGYHAAKKVSGCSCGAGKWIMYRSKCGPAEVIEHTYNQLDGSHPTLAGYGSRSRYYK
jgi:hypothetical protein